MFSIDLVQREGPLLRTTRLVIPAAGNVSVDVYRVCLHQWLCSKAMFIESVFFMAMFIESVFFNGYVYLSGRIHLLRSRPSSMACVRILRSITELLPLCYRCEGSIGSCSISSSFSEELCLLGPLVGVHGMDTHMQLLDITDHKLLVGGIAIYKAMTLGLPCGPFS
ncbi:hypothetical protein L3X38_011420 [Prunus dulcis]|uniref:Uncharacterized protein n=1 Tax=Prunus dulcis TaxID=3755 RepID=A0AAD4WHR5_PRUDU|nr:hypothetical protein L3X38_011420 [Prunus dulcis]